MKRDQVAVLACAWLLAGLAMPASAERGATPFVVSYRCDGNRWVAVAYPAFRDARHAPIRLAWRGRSVLLYPARAGSGASYKNAQANLVWWSKGREGFLNRLRDNAPLLQGCKEG